ncbi:NADP-dependent oxidoreductase [Roseomonas aerophila]|uniref:NADP-dependent oxidoreductase n=1 Tax=Teichococcus aerophilus TaxID=1224513 RepID=A0ABR7RLH5_9PROT|nr:NADP-dependent oxidoreductase [Pseudoroseomonas aerophila]MBC9207159.1 NADP-dependent oxidoreductase [Pseudoroseomonas aerophila]
MPSITSRQIRLAARPEGKPGPEHFRFEDEVLPAPADGQVVLQNLYLSLDPYMRGRMNATKSYSPPVEIGAVMEGGSVSRVLESKDPGFAVGDIVLSHTGWQTHAVADAAGLRKLDPKLAPVSTALGVLGMPGFTAYTGLLTLGQPKPGETVVVAAATGPVGSAVGQIARIKGARAVGIAGGAKKCAFLRDELGFDAAIDHRAPDFAEQLKAACPDGIDVYFENVGGAVWDAVFPLLNTFARVPVCGLISQYNGAGASGAESVPGLMRQVLTRSLTIRGFIQREFADQRPAFLRDMADWIAKGELRYREDIVEGLENMPHAFAGLLEGRNFGKLVIKLAD